ncbi:MAG: preprotein translocase subunit SecG [Arenimonas sp.]|nr:preprotein translocase subunit SecG [Arenimonas sp.]
MIHTLLNVLYVLIAIAMIVLILLQRGAGAQAGSGFGAGASGTVFGARGSANFLSSTTKWLAAVFFGMSLFMAWQASHNAKRAPDQVDLGVMSDLPAAAGKPAAPASAELVPAPSPAIPPAAEAAPIIAPASPAAVAPDANAAPSPAEDSKGG